MIVSSQDCYLALSQVSVRRLFYLPTIRPWLYLTSQGGRTKLWWNLVGGIPNGFHRILNLSIVRVFVIQVQFRVPCALWFVECWHLCSVSYAHELLFCNCTALVMASSRSLTRAIVSFYGENYLKLLFNFEWFGVILENKNDFKSFPIILKLFILYVDFELMSI